MEIYKNIIDRLTINFKKNNFKKKATTFYFKEFENWGVINFQKSRDIIPNSAKFTINFGILSTKLRRTREDIAPDVLPVIQDCHLIYRVGFFLPENKDFWWVVNSNTDTELLTNQLINITETIIIPTLRKQISDDALIDLWFGSQHSGITEFTSLIYLTILLQIKRDSRLDDAIELFKRKYPEERTFYHIENLQKYV